MIGAAQPLEDEIAQAAAHRIADQERTGEHRDGGGDADDNGHIGPPVVSKAAKNEQTE